MCRYKKEAFYKHSTLEQITAQHPQHWGRYLFIPLHVFNAEIVDNPCLSVWFTTVFLLFSSKLGTDHSTNGQRRSHQSFYLCKRPSYQQLLSLESMAALFGSQSIHRDLYEFSVDSSHLVKRTSFQNNPGGIKNLCLLADIPSRARFAVLKGWHGWKQLCFPRCVSSACPLLCSITLVPCCVQDFAPALKTTISQEYSTKTFGLEELLWWQIQGWSKLKGICCGNLSQLCDFSALWRVYTPEPAVWWGKAVSFQSCWWKMGYRQHDQILAMLGHR